MDTAVHIVSLGILSVHDELNQYASADRLEHSSYFKSKIMLVL